MGERGSVAAKDGDELDRPRMLSLAATAMSEAFTSCGGAVVNLKKPQVKSRQVVLGAMRTILWYRHMLLRCSRFPLGHPLNFANKIGSA